MMVAVMIVADATSILPVWAQIIAGVGIVVTAIAVIGTKVVLPMFRFARRVDEIVPLMTELTGTFKNSPESFEVLKQIVAQFRTDSGSSLRDVVNRLDAASVENVRSNELLRIAATTAKEMADRDRSQIDRLVLLLDRLTITQASADERTAGVAANLVIAQTAVDDVAKDLAESHRRADEVAGQPGEAADAAAQRTSQERVDQKKTEQ
jgi:hypothetical protein